MHRVQWEQNRTLTEREVTDSDLVEGCLDMEEGARKAKVVFCFPGS